MIKVVGVDNNAHYTAGLSRAGDGAGDGYVLFREALILMVAVPSVTVTVLAEAKPRLVVVPLIQVIASGGELHPVVAGEKLADLVFAVGVSSGASMRVVIKVVDVDVNAPTPPGLSATGDGAGDLARLLQEASMPVVVVPAVTVTVSADAILIWLSYHSFA